MYKFSFILFVLSLAVPQSNGDIFVASTDLEDEIYDLGWPLNNQTLHWPTATSFQSTVYHDGTEFSEERNGTYYYKSDGFSMGTHVGTHLDAPIHFGNTSWTVDQIPLNRLVNVPFYVVDLSKNVQLDTTYCFQKSDFVNDKNQKSFAGSVVIVYTGMSLKYAKGQEEYFGTSSTDYSKIKIPGFSKEAAEFLVEKKVYGVGLDSPSADCSKRHDSNRTLNPEAHAVFNSENIYILENLNDQVEELKDLPSKDYRLTIIPLQMTNFSGSPVRPIVTSVPSSALTLRMINLYLLAFLLLIIALFSRNFNMSL